MARGFQSLPSYYKPKRDRLGRAEEDLDIRAAIEKIREDLPVSGYRTLLRYLLREHGIHTNHLCGRINAVSYLSLIHI